MQITDSISAYSELKRIQSEFEPRVLGAAQQLKDTVENLKGIKGKENISKAAKGFESLFIYRMLEEMRKTVPKDALFGNSFGMDVFNSMLDEKVANRIAESGRFGISKMLIEYMEKEYERKQTGLNENKPADNPVEKSPEAVSQKQAEFEKSENTIDATPFSRNESPPVIERVQSFMSYVNEAAEKYQVDPDLIKAIIAQESAGDPKAVSKSGAKGLMQLMDGTADALNVKDVFDPRENILAGVRYLKGLLVTFQGDLSLALAAYNAGPTTVQLYGGIPPYSETQNYIQKVVSFRNFFRSAEPI
jgi:Rod binding domain-containing protein